MKNLLILIVLSSFGLSRLDAQNPIPFVAYWEQGDTFQFKISKIKQQWNEAGEITKDDTSSYVAKFEILDSAETFYKIKWSYQLPLLNAISTLDDVSEKTVDFLKEYENNDVIYTTDETGTFTGIENWEEIAERAKKTFQVLIDGYDGDGKEKRQFEKSMTPLMATFTSKEAIENIYYTELMLFHFPFGVEFDADEIIEYVDELPNVLGGRPIKCDAQIFFKDVNHDEYYAHLIQTTTANPKDVNRLMMDFVKTMKLKDREVEKVLKNAVFDINDYNSYEYYYYPGIPIKIENTRKVKLDMNEIKFKAIQKTIIELLD